MQVIAFVLGEKKALENKHEKACTGVQVKLHKKNATICIVNREFSDLWYNINNKNYSQTT